MPATTDFLPRKEAELVVWSTTFKNLIVATPTAYGLTAAQATAYTTLHDSFVTQYNLANADGTRTPSVIVSKNQAKRFLIANARLLAGIIQRDPETTNQQRSDLGLTVPSTRSPIPPPAIAPSIDVLSVTGSVVRIRMHDPVNTTRRGKPPGVAGMTVFSFVGANPPTTAGDWKFEGNTTRTTLNINFPNAAPGATVWFTAFYRNERDQSGPAADPVSTRIAGGSAMAA